MHSGHERHIVNEVSNGLKIDLDAVVVVHINIRVVILDLGVRIVVVDVGVVLLDLELCL